ncbi:hypothetical protein MRX96_017311 [Rhipicephalus microplus]
MEQEVQVIAEFHMRACLFIERHGCGLCSLKCVPWRTWEIIDNVRCVVENRRYSQKTGHTGSGSTRRVDILQSLLDAQEVAKTDKDNDASKGGANKPGGFFEPIDDNTLLANSLLFLIAAFETTASPPVFYPTPHGSASRRARQVYILRRIAYRKVAHKNERKAPTFEEEKHDSPLSSLSPPPKRHGATCRELSPDIESFPSHNLAVTSCSWTQAQYVKKHTKRL